MNPRVYADFNNLDDENRIRLTTKGTTEDLRRLGINLFDGLPLTFYMDDADDQGNRDDLLIDGTVHFSAEDQCWVAKVAWDAAYRSTDQAGRAAG